MRPSLTVGLLSLFTATLAVDTLVDLGYAQYQGLTLGNNVNQWLGLRFAAPCTPPLRFSAAQPPVAEATVQDATKEGPICVSANNPEGLQFDSPRQFMAEDCLFAAVYAPANATESSKLPVMMFVSGGGFNSNSNANFNGTGLVEASGMGMVVVRANYRVGMLGFLAGTLVEADAKGATSNNGLKDMVAAARWVKQHAAKFGGDPDHIVITGASSGGNAIDILLAANDGVGFPDLFAGAIAESTGWGSEGYTVDRDNALTNNLKATGCDAKPDPIDCLRTLPIGELQVRSTTDSFGPTIEGKFLTAPHYQLYEAGRFQQIPVIYGYTSDEATPNFIANQTVNTTGEVLDDVRGDIGASVTDEEIAQVEAAYPASLNTVSVFGRDMTVRNASVLEGTGAQWQRDAAIQTELKLHCVAAFFADMFAAAGQPPYAYRYNVLDETAGGNADKGLFSPHTSELYAVWGANNTDGGDPGCLTLPATDPLSCASGAATAQAYWISFVRTLNPNTMRLAGSPEWTPWSIAQPNRILLDNAAASMEVMGAAVGEVPLAGVDQRQRCLGLTLPFSKRMNQGLGEGEVLPAFANGTRTDPTLVAQQQQQQSLPSAPQEVAPSPPPIEAEGVGDGKVGLNVTTTKTSESAEVPPVPAPAPAPAPEQASSSSGSSKLPSPLPDNVSDNSPPGDVAALGGQAKKAPSIKNSSVTLNVTAIESTAGAVAGSASAPEQLPPASGGLQPAPGMSMSSSVALGAIGAPLNSSTALTPGTLGTAQSVTVSGAAGLGLARWSMAIGAGMISVLVSI